MSKTFSDEQIKITKDLLEMEQEICNRVNSRIQEDFLRKPMNTEELADELDSIKKSVEYAIDEKFRQMKRNL